MSIDANDYSGTAFRALRLFATPHGRTAVPAMENETHWFRWNETHWFRWRLGLLDFDQGLVGPFCSVEDGFELCGR